jgi:hypothetical protein
MWHGTKERKQTSPLMKKKILTWNAFLVLVLLFIGSFGGMATRMSFYFAGCL